MNKKIMHIYAPGGVATPLKICCEEFGKENNFEFKFNFGKVSFLIEKLKESKKGDLISFGAETFADKLEDEGIIDRKNRYFLGTREPALLVPKGNPKNIKNFADIVKRDDIKIGVAYDGCLIGIWESILLNYNPLLIDKFRNKITSLADSCGKTVRDLFEEKNDLIIAWNTFAKFKEKDIHIVEIEEKIKVRRATNISLINYSEHKDMAIKLIEFIKSERGKSIYKKYDWKTY